MSLNYLIDEYCNKDKKIIKEVPKDFYLNSKTFDELIEEVELTNRKNKVEDYEVYIIFFELEWTSVYFHSHSNVDFLNPLINLDKEKQTSSNTEETNLSKSRVEELIDLKNRK